MGLVSDVALTSTNHHCPAMSLTDEELDRYARHIVLREVGVRARRAARGAGRHRRGRRSRHAVNSVFGGGRRGNAWNCRFRPCFPVESPAPDRPSYRRYGPAKDRCRDGRGADGSIRYASGSPSRQLNPDNALESYPATILVADGSDNFATRFLVNDACFFAGKTLGVRCRHRVRRPACDIQGACEGRSCPVIGVSIPSRLHPARLHPVRRPAFWVQRPASWGRCRRWKSSRRLSESGKASAGKLLIYDALAVRFRTWASRRTLACRPRGPRATIKGLFRGPHRPRREAYDVIAGPILPGASYAMFRRPEMGTMRSRPGRFFFSNVSILWARAEHRSRSRCRPALKRG